MKRSLAITEKALGPDHLDLMQSLDNLAALYETQGRYAEAEPLRRRALAIRDKELGPEGGGKPPEAAPVVTSSIAAPTVPLPARPKRPKKAPKAPDWRTEVWR